MPDVTATAGDCFNSIAKAQGFYNYRSIYDYDTNATNFPNPNQIEAGSTVKVPDKTMKAFDLPVDTEKRFKIIRKATNFELRICKAAADQVPGMTSANLQVGKKAASGITGTLKIDDIDPTVKSATLTVVMANPAAFAAAFPTDAGVANQNPPAVIASDFDDPATNWPTTGETVTWTLELGGLEPAMVTRGVLQRMRNLGFTCPIQKFENEATRRAVKTYRRAAEALLPPNDTESVSEIRAHVRLRHDNP